MTTQEKRKKGDSRDIYILPFFYLTNCKKKYHMLYFLIILCNKSE